MALEWVVEEARRRGPIAAGSYRVIVGEWNGGVSSYDAPDFESARRYADDAASEAEELPSPVAYVLDSGFHVVERGMHYALRLSSDSK